MELNEIVTISGIGGLHKVITERPNGMVVCALGEKINKFIPSRNHNFTQLDNITIYTQEDTKSLASILDTMKKTVTKTPIVDAKAKPDELRAYFTKIVSDYDPERVYVSDIQKVLKWYVELDAHKYFESKPKKDRKGAKGGDKKTTVKKAPSKAKLNQKVSGNSKISSRSAAKNKPVATTKASGRKA